MTPRRPLISAIARFVVAAVASVAVQALATAPAAAKTIFETTKDIGTFDVLVRALKAAGLSDTLNGPGPYTLFAPTDDAFSKLPRGTAELLLKPENRERLKAILTHHVVAGSILSRDLLGTYLCAGVFAMVLWQVFQSIAMTIGIMPITGLPLPFISYGGSGLVTFFALIGLVQNVHMRRYR